MDRATLIGIIAGVALLALAMARGGSAASYVDAPGLMIVAGGTLAATLIQERLGRVLGAVRVGLQAFLDKPAAPRAAIDQVVWLAARARKDGLASLDGVRIANPVLARGVRLGADGLAPETVLAILEDDLQALARRHERGQAVFRFMGATAPAMGMVGTLVGLVQMLRQLERPSQIGPAMSLALLTTLYGAILAFLFFNPIAAKLAHRTAEEIVEQRVAIAGVEAILKGDGALAIRSRLEALHGAEPGAREVAA